MINQQNDQCNTQCQPPLMIPSAAPSARASSPCSHHAPAVPPPVATPVESTGKPLEIPLDHIERNPFQTRTRFDEAQLEELTQSIAASGVVQPIVVRPLSPQRAADTS